YMRDVPDVERLISNLQPHVFLVYCPNSDPKLQGFWHFDPATGTIEVVEWQEPPQEEPTEEESPPSEPDEETPSGDEPASSPAAADASPTATAPAIATNTTPTTPGSSPETG
ncbi:MAG: hypothetical protein L3K23_10660, partial [Thermoplasmata archaeon]|nr:hypothetical protein [Thermoplasmata archaeon]